MSTLECPFCNGGIESGDELTDHLTDEHSAFRRAMEDGPLPRG